MDVKSENFATVVKNTGSTPDHKRWEWYRKNPKGHKKHKKAHLRGGQNHSRIYLNFLVDQVRSNPPHLDSALAPRRFEDLVVKSRR